MKCPECGANEARSICRHCGTDLKSIKQERILNKIINNGSITTLPVYNKSEDYDFENLIAYSVMLGWDNLEFDFEYSITNRLYLGRNRYDVAGFGITSDCIGQINIAALLEKGVKFKSALGESSCVIVTATAKAEVLGIKVDGRLDDDGWNGSIGKAIKFGNQVLKKQFDEYYQNGASIDDIKLIPMSCVTGFEYVEDEGEDENTEPLEIEYERKLAGSRKEDDAKKIQEESEFKRMKAESKNAIVCTIYILAIGIFGLSILSDHSIAALVGLITNVISLKVIWGSERSADGPEVIGSAIVGTVVVAVYLLVIFL